MAQAVDTTGRVLVPAGATPLLTHAELAAALEGEVLVDRPVPGIGDDARVLARRLDDGRGDAVVGVTATTTAQLLHVRHRLVVVLLVGGTALTAAVALTGWVLAGAALRPVRRMAQRAETISMTAPGERLPVPPGGDEIAELGRTLNAMLVRIEATIAHERAFIDDASHELRTPLAVLRGELELATQDDDLDAVRQGLRSALEETDRLSRLSDNLLTLARVDAGQLPAGPVCTDLLDAVCAAVARIPCPDTVTLTVEGVHRTVRGGPEWIDRVVTNLVATPSSTPSARCASRWTSTRRRPADRCRRRTGISRRADAAGVRQVQPRRRRPEPGRIELVSPSSPRSCRPQRIDPGQQRDTAERRQLEVTVPDPGA